MRVLCLHGHGTSSDIFETQLSAIRELLDESIEYIYIDGPVECDRVRGMSDMVPGPFFGWFSGFSPDQVQITHSLVAEALEEDGPFDAIFGFSQGATLALSYLLEQQIKHPNKSPPVHFAVLFSCAGPALSSDTDLSRDIISGLAPEDFEELQRLTAGQKANGHGLAPSCPPRDSRKDTFLATMSTALQLGGENGFIVTSAEIEQWRLASGTDREKTMTRVFHPSLTSARVKIPTIHVLGESDTANVREQAKLCRDLCDPRSVEMLGHSAAHDVPRKPHEARRVVEAIHAAKAEACLKAY